MKAIAIVGSRGIPASYGGYETYTENLALGLDKNDIHVYVTCERSYKKKWFGLPVIGTFWVTRLFFPVIDKLRLISEVFYDIVWLLFFTFKTDVKIVYLLGYGAAFFAWLPRLTGKVVLLHVDGLEWTRRKWMNRSSIVGLALHICEYLSHITANHVIYDSKTIAEYHETHYPQHNSFTLPYIIHTNRSGHALISPEYYLNIARWVPENNIDAIMEGFEMSNANSLVLISNHQPFVQGKTICLGPMYGAEVHVFREFAKGYIHGIESGGTSPSLLEAMGHGNVIISKDTPSNREV